MIIEKATRRWEGVERGDKTWMPIQFVSYNIFNGHKVGLYLALREVAQANLYLGVLQETKLIDRV